MGQMTGADIQPEQLLSSWLTTPLGPMLAVVSDDGLVLLEFEGRTGLERSLERLRAGAMIEAGRNEWTDSIEAELAAYFAGSSSTFLTPIELSGTEFQLSVWRELQRIPAGTTLTYLELAQAVGSPSGFRAVAQANGANRLAVVVPCHRVVNTGGGLGGYGGGLERKRELLEHESSAFGGAASGRLF